MARGRTQPSETLPEIHQFLRAKHRVGAGTQVDPIRDRVKAYDARLMPVRPTVTVHEPPEDPAELWIVLSDRADARINGGMAPNQSTPTSEQCMRREQRFQGRCNSTQSPADHRGPRANHDGRVRRTRLRRWSRRCAPEQGSTLQQVRSHLGRSLAAIGQQGWCPGE